MGRVHPVPDSLWQGKLQRRPRFAAGCKEKLTRSPSARKRHRDPLSCDNLLHQVLYPAAVHHVIHTKSPKYAILDCSEPDCGQLHFLHNFTIYYCFSMFAEGENLEPTTSWPLREL